MIGKSKKVVIASLVSAMALSTNVIPLFAAEETADAKGKDIVVLYTNDIHCGVDDKIGFAGLAAYKAEMVKTYGKDQVTLVDCGDAIQGAAIGTLSNGAYMVDIMNAVGYDYAVFGNHEFDYTIPELSKLVDQADAKYVACNFKYISQEIKDDAAKTDAKDAKGASTKIEVAPYEIKDYNGVKVAYVGICTPETLFKSTPAYFMDEKGNDLYSFCQGNDGKDLYAAVQTAVDNARKEGANYVVALAHLGIEETSAPYRSTDVIKNTTGIDVVLDGHSHSVVASDKVANAKGEEVILSQTGTKLEAIGKLVITADGKISTELVKDYAAKDEATTQVVKKIQDDLAKVLNEVVAKSDVELNVNAADGARAVRNRETAIGDLCADAYRAVSGADIAFVNGGGIRATIKKGDITYNDIISVHPYGNELCVVEATGQEVLDALEMGSKSVLAETSAKAEDGTNNAVGESGGFLQVSGIKYTVDPSIKSSVVVDDKGLFVKVEGERRVKDVQVLNSKTGKYEAIDPAKTYTVSSHNYMLKSMGDGYSMFADNKLLQDSVMLDNQVLITYIKDKLNGVIGKSYEAPQGRITVAVANEAKKAA